MSSSRGLTCLLSAFLSLTGSFAQNLYQPFEFPAQIPSPYQVDAITIYNKLLFSTKSKKISKDEIARYCEFMSFGKKSCFTSGHLYCNWEKAENYLNNVLHQILPDSLKNRKNIHVYLTRDADFNAYSIYDGSIFFNIGSLAEIPDEATTAFILGHEVAHYLHNDSYRQYEKNVIESNRSDFKSKSVEISFAKADYSREAERDADSLGYLFASTAGIRLHDMLTFFYEDLIQQNISEKANQRKHILNVGSKRDSGLIANQKLVHDMLLDHPVSKERIDFLTKLDQTNRNKKYTKGFSVDNQLFRSLQQQARYERLNTCIQNLDFYDCVLYAFTYYLYQPDNANYLYFMLDGIRKLVATEDEYEKKGFLTQHLKSYFKSRQGVLHNLNLLFTDSTAMGKIKDKALADTSTVAFENYEQAFGYFLKKSLALGFNEANLIAAQWNFNQEALRKNYCEMYLENPAAKYKEYATQLMNNGLSNSLKPNANELFVINYLNEEEEYNDGVYKRFIASNEESPGFLNELGRQMKKKYPDKQFLILDSLKEKAFDKYNKMGVLIELSFMLNGKNDKSKERKNEVYFDGGSSAEQKSNKPDLFTLDQGLWYFFKEHKIARLEYVSTSTYENKKRARRQEENYLQIGYFCFDIHDANRIRHTEKQYKLKDLDISGRYPKYVMELMESR